MTLSSRHRIRNSSPSGLRPSTLPLGHGGSPQYWVSHVDGEETFCFFQSAETGPPLYRFWHSFCWLMLRFVFNMFQSWCSLYVILNILWLLMRKKNIISIGDIWDVKVIFSRNVRRYYNIALGSYLNFMLGMVACTTYGHTIIVKLLPWQQWRFV